VRSTIGAIGGSMGNGNLMVQQTAGQPSATSFTTNIDGASLRQGFQQPFYYEKVSGVLNAHIFPNPNNGQFSFRADVTEYQLVDFVVIDQTGKEVYQNQGVGPHVNEVYLANPAAGNYHLRITSGNQTSAFKIIVTP
jgi:hypothetical protein